MDYTRYMEQSYRDYKDLLDQFKPKELAADLDVSRVTIQTWRNRNAIPIDRYGFRLVQSAERRGVPGVTADLLLELSEYTRLNNL